MTYGYFGKILWINLTDESYEIKNISDKLYEQYLGGVGLAVRLIYENQTPGIDPLSSDSIFGFFPGLLTSTNAPLSGRFFVAGKSPLTGTWGDANAGGIFGPEIKKCGFDGILIEGTANSPKYVSVIDKKIEFNDANNIWGLDIIEADKKLKELHGSTIKTAGIGQAGENVSLISGIANDRGRIAARSGIGAIMGSKKLKMLVLKGNEKIPLYDKKTFIDAVRLYNKNVKSDTGKITKFIIDRVPKMAKLMRRLNIGMSGPSGLIQQVYRNLGTSAGNTIAAETGDSPIKNWAGIGMYDFPYEKSKNISSMELNKFKVKDYGCFSCPIRCGAILEVPEADLEETHLPEYETCAAFGMDLLNNDLISLLKVNEICNRAAIDTISTGATIAFAMECYEKGILTKEDTDGLDLSWGNSEAIISLTKKIINREGIGNILADGADVAAQKIGKGSEKFAMTSLGQEVAMHNPRIFESLAHSYAYDPTPGRHTTPSVDFYDVGNINNYLEGFELPKGWDKDKTIKAEAQKLTIGAHNAVISSGLCIFTSLFGFYPLATLINSATGWDKTTEDLISIGIRIQTLRQAFTLREMNDFFKHELPGRIYGEPPFEKGPTKDVTVEYKEFSRLVFEEMGWNPENGIPLQETLKDLDLEFVINDFY